MILILILKWDLPNIDIDFEIEMGLGQILILISILKWDLPNIDFDIESQNPILLMSAPLPPKLQKNKHPTFLAQTKPPPPQAEKKVWSSKNITT